MTIEDSFLLIKKQEITCKKLFFEKSNPNYVQERVILNTHGLKGENKYGTIWRKTIGLTIVSIKNATPRSVCVKNLLRNVQKKNSRLFEAFKLKSVIKKGKFSFFLFCNVECHTVWNIGYVFEVFCTKQYVLFVNNCIVNIKNKMC